ncbi:MAG: hypothetical protein HND52_19770 [Ignavibacteriae bacterium]|nr:hypothetical protein [Ignavibacteriota bacterium]NOH00207.1 hypothetical protein [Ignavibacteriota bacterium]
MKKYLVHVLFITFFIVGCHELPYSKAIHYYIMNDSSYNSNFYFLEKKSDLEVNIKGHSVCFRIDERGIIFSTMIVNLKNSGKNGLHISFEDIELQSNYYQFSFVDNLEKFDLNVADTTEFKLLFRTQDREDIEEVPIDDILMLKLKLFVNGEKINVPHVSLSPKKNI